LPGGDVTKKPSTPGCWMKDGLLRKALRAAGDAYGPHIRMHFASRRHA
jgi:hypothetical protein